MLKTCTKCKITKNISEFGKLSRNKDGLRPACKECEKLYRKQNKERRKEYDKEYRKQNKEKRSEYNKEYLEKNKGYNKEYYERNKENIAKQGKEYRKQNEEKIAKRAKEYREKNKERRKEYLEKNKEYISKRVKKYRTKNKEQIKEYKKEYNKTPKGKMVGVNSNSRRRYRKLHTSDGTIPFSITYPLTQELQALLTLQENKCYLCNCDLLEKHLDHHTPLSKGGTHSIDNVVWLCPTCNLSKGTNVPSELLLI